MSKLLNCNTIYEKRIVDCNNPSYRLFIKLPTVKAYTKGSIKKLSNFALPHATQKL